MVLTEQVKKTLVVRYGAELRAINQYLDVIDDMDEHDKKVLLDECKLRLVFLDYLHRLLISAHVDMYAFNGQYVTLMRRVYNLKKGM